MVGLPTAANGSGLQQRFFLSPSGNISCELDFDPTSAVRGLPTRAFCETFTPGRAVTMSARGRVKVCQGTGCVGNPPENAFTLRYGHQARLGPFVCRSQTDGMRCTIASGRGFLISRSGIRRL